MALYENAVLRLLPENDSQPRIKPVLAIWHSAVDAPGPTSLYSYFGRAEVRLESHFFIKLDGTVEQYMDTEVRADANYRVNSFWRDGVRCGAISVETEDDGNPDQRLWTPEQIDSSVELGLWIVDTHDIPPVLAEQWNGNGFGWHVLFPRHWTNVSSKTCPGTVRIPQFRNEILPRIAEVQEDEIVPELEIIKAFAEYLGRVPSDKEVQLHAWYAAVNGVVAAVLNIARSEEAEGRR